MKPKPENDGIRPIPVSVRLKLSASCTAAMGVTTRVVPLVAIRRPLKVPMVRFAGVSVSCRSAMPCAGTVTVSGQGRGFEGTLAVSAFRPGDDAAPVELQHGARGAADLSEPYSVELDLSGAADGEVVVILVRGDTGLGSDPGTFAAIPVVIASVASPTSPPTR